jgi:periplasmic protein CpxP/Spy
MNFKKLSLVATIAFTLIALPQNANAKTPSTSTQQVAQAQPPSIKLSPKQQQDIEKIRAKVRNQVKNVMTKEQITQVETAMKAGQSPRDAFANVKFTTQQQQSLRQIMISSQQEMEGVLTTEQKQQLQQYRQSQQPKK